MKTTVVPLGRLSPRERRFSFSNDIDISHLAASIKKHGLLSPPLLYEERGRLAVVSGRRRLQALRQLAEVSVRARILGDEFVSPIEAWSLNFEETITVRKIDAAEACRAAAQLVSFGVEEGKIVQTYLTPLGLPPKTTACRDALAVAACGERLLTLLAGGTAVLSTAAYVASLDSEDRTAAMRHLERAPLTVSQQREWTRLLSDISRRDGITIRGLLATAARRATDDKGKGSAIVQYLRERRYPSLTERKKAFAALLARFPLPPGMRIEPHPFFERDELRISHTSRDAASYDRALKTLERIRRDPAFPSLLSDGGKGKK